jgi:hypothetical protein
VPPFVFGGFAWVPLELQVAHPSRIFTLYCSGKVPPDPPRRLAVLPSDLPDEPKVSIMAGDETPIPERRPRVVRMQNIDPRIQLKTS